MAATTVERIAPPLDPEDETTAEAMNCLDMFMPDWEWKYRLEGSSFARRSLVTDFIANHLAAGKHFLFEALPDEMRKAIMVQEVVGPTLGQFVCFGPYRSEFRNGDRTTSAIHIKEIWPTRMMLVSKTCYHDALYACWVMFKDSKFILRFEHHPKKVDNYTKYIPRLFHKCQEVSTLAGQPAPKIRLTLLLPSWFDETNLAYKIDWVRMFVRSPEMLNGEKLEIRFLGGGTQTRQPFFVLVIKELLKLKRIARKIVEDELVPEDGCLDECTVEKLIKKVALRYWHEAGF